MMIMIPANPDTMIMMIKISESESAYTCQLVSPRRTQE